MPKNNTDNGFIQKDDDILVVRMHKAISVIQLKLEGQTSYCEFSNSEILFTLSLERLLVSKVKARYSFIMHLASSMPTTCEPMVIMLAAIETPIPVPQRRIPLSYSLLTTDCASLNATLA